MNEVRGHRYYRHPSSLSSIIMITITTDPPPLNVDNQLQQVQRQVQSLRRELEQVRDTVRAMQKVVPVNMVFLG